MLSAAQRQCSCPPKQQRTLCKSNNSTLFKTVLLTNDKLYRSVDDFTRKKKRNCNISSTPKLYVGLKTKYTGWRVRILPDVCILNTFA